MLTGSSEIIGMGQKFRYFISIIKEVYTIVKLNYDVKKENLHKLINIISRHLEIYNDKNKLLRFTLIYNEETNIMTIFMSDYSQYRGYKKIFKDEINIKAVKRKMLIAKINRLVEIQKENDTADSSDNQENFK